MIKNLIRAELHKVYDTRAAKIILALAFGFVCLSSAMIIHLNAGINMSILFFGAVYASHLFIGILICYFICQEWRHDLALTTYVTTPKRLNIVIAKLCVVLVIYIVALIFLTLFSFLLSLIVSASCGISCSASIGCNAIGCGPYYHTALISLAFSVLLATAMSYFIKDQTWSITLYLILPALTILLVQFPYIREIDSWLALTYIPSIGNLGLCGGQEWYHVAVSALIWIGIPLGVGIVRSIKEDV